MLHINDGRDGNYELEVIGKAKRSKKYGKRGKITHY